MYRSIHSWLSNNSNSDIQMLIDQFSFLSPSRISGFREPTTCRWGWRVYLIAYSTCERTEHIVMDIHVVVEPAICHCRCGDHRLTGQWDACRQACINVGKLSVVVTRTKYTNTTHIKAKTETPERESEMLMVATDGGKGKPHKKL